MCIASWSLVQEREGERERERERDIQKLKWAFLNSSMSPVDVERPERGLE
jgi:hypothetical protein